MRKVFGKPSKRTRLSGNSTCEVTWKKLGLKAWISNFGGARKHICKQNGARLQQAVVSGKQWVTADRGLRVGDSFDRLIQLYPGSQTTLTSKGEAWSISSFYYSPISAGGEASDVTARAKNGAIVSFVIWVGGAGE